MDVQADLILSWSQRLYCRFCCAPVHWLKCLSGHSTYLGLCILHMWWGYTSKSAYVYVGWFRGVSLQGSYMSEKCQGNLNFFKVREFCDVSGKNEILQKCKGIVREFHISVWWRWDVWSGCVFFAKFIKFLAPILSGKFEFVSEKCQGIVREFWLVLNVWTLPYHTC